MPYVRMANPRRRRPKARRRNPGGLLVLTNPRRRRRRSTANPTRRRRRTHRSNPVTRHRRTRRSNPAVRMHRRRGSRRNPNLKDALGVGVGAAVGAVATRGLTQAFLGANNTSYMGIGANLVVAYGLSWAAEKVGAPANFALGILAGGIAGAAQRAYEMLVAPSATAAMSGLGDAWYSSNGLGDYTSYTPLPATSYPPNPASLGIGGPSMIALG